MKLNKIIVFLLFILTITVSGLIVNFQNKEYNLLDQRYEALKQAYTKLEETSKQVKNNDPTIKKLRKKVSNLQKKLNSENESDSLPNQNYLQIKYWYDNKNYELSDKNQKLYKNPFLSKKILDKVIFVSSTISEIELENGQTVYSAMSSEGLVYSSSYIDLIELNSTNYSLSSDAVSSNENNKYIKTLFWNISEERRLGEDSEQKWYYDYTLSNEVNYSKNLIIVSEIDHFIASNGVDLYAALTKNGEIVYMHESPDLETIEN